MCHLEEKSTSSVICSTYAIMFSLAQFDDQAYFITRSKNVKITGGKDCIVKYKGWKYHATLIQTADFEAQLRKLQEELESGPRLENSNTEVSTSDNIKINSVSNSTNHSYQVRGDACSTPIDGVLLPPPEHLTSLSDIIDDGKFSTTFANNSADSSLPPSGCTDIINVVGNTWMKDFGKTYELEDVSQVNNTNRNYLINLQNSSLDQNGEKKGESAERGKSKTRDDNEKHKLRKERHVDKETAYAEGREDNEQQNNNEKRQICEKREVDKGSADVEELEDNEQRNNNEKRNTSNEREADEGTADAEELEDNEQRNNNEKRNTSNQREADEGITDAEELEDNEQRNNNEKRNTSNEREVDEGIADAEELEDNEQRNNNEKRKTAEERDVDEGRTGYRESKQNDSGSDGDEQMQNDYEQYDQDEDYIDEEGTDNDDDDIEKDSDYVPDQSTSKRSFLISQVNLTRNLSKSVIDALPVDIRSISVPPSQNLTSRSAKKYFCPYCKKLQTKFARHLEMKHKSEADVAKFIKLPKGNSERAKIIETIRKHGNFLHNTDSNLNTGILITCRQRQPKFDRSVEDYVCCSNCKGFFSKETLRLHAAKCNSTHKKGVRDITVMGRRLAGYIHELANPVLRREVFPVMRDDEVVRSIKYDELIILFANRLCDKYTHTHQHDMIRAQLRLLGRFKCAIKNINKDIDDFASIFHPKFYDAAILAVRECAKYDSVTQTFETPAVDTMLGTLIKKCVSRRKAQCIRKQDYDGKKAAEEFLVLFEDDFPTTINKKVMEDQTKQKRQKKIILPSNQDIRQLYDFLKKKCQTSLKTLEKQFDLSAWKILTECTLILVQIFNRRRAGEIERLLVSDYENQTELDENVNADLYAKLSNESREYAKQFARLTIRGKLGRTVPVLLYPLHVACINMIFKYRTEAGVKSDNEYIFSVPNSGRLKKKYLRACALMRKFSQECGAVMPTSLRGTTLRKHIATYFAMEGIGENEVADLANFMGHDKQIHKDVYRVPIPIREITHVSRLLQAAMGQSEDEDSSDEADEPNDERNDEPNDEISCKEVSRKSQKNSDPQSFSNTMDSSDTESEESSADTHNTGKKISTKRRSTSPYGKTKRIRWTTDEKAAVQKVFGDLSKLKKLPSLAQCQQAIQKFKALKNRKPQVIKTWIDNQRKSASRRAQNQS